MKEDRQILGPYARDIEQAIEQSHREAEEQRRKAVRNFYLAMLSFSAVGAIGIACLIAAWVRQMVEVL